MSNDQISTLNNMHTHNSFRDATGEIHYNMLNDYMFRIVLQNSLPALKSIIAAVLRIHPDIITEISVNNSILPGEVINEKEYRMDISITFNRTNRIDIEMQVCDLKNWTERSLHYLCREYEKGLTHGDAYNVKHAAYQIGFLDYTLFNDHIKFLSSFGLCDLEDHYRFNRNFVIYVIDLTQIDKASDVDKKSELDKWCRLFKATTWDEVKKIVKEDRIMEAVAEDMYINNSDEAIQKRCQDRAEYLARNKWYESELEKTREERDQATAGMEILRAQLLENGIKPNI